MLSAKDYLPLLHFFSSTGWDLTDLRTHWYYTVAQSGYIMKTSNGKKILAGDGCKQSKEARYMPGVKKLFQESEDTTKPTYIFGHLYGAIGALAESSKEVFCIPMRMSIQDGLSEAADWEESTVSNKSHVEQIIQNGSEVAEQVGDSVLLLDRYFLTRPALKMLNKCNAEAKHKLYIVTKAKDNNLTAYEEPEPKKPGQRGAPRKKGATIKPWTYFKNKDLFQNATVKMYGEEKEVQYLCRDLLWGKGLYQKLRFVLVMIGDTRSILVSTDLTLPPTEIIVLYSRRFRIETLFRSFKQDICGFGYHFWTKAIEKMNRFKKKDDPDPLSKISEEDDQKKVLRKVRAIECFVHLCCIATGIIQLLSFQENEESKVHRAFYLRTYRRKKASEAMVLWYLRKYFFALLASKSDLSISQIIRKAQNGEFRKKKGA